jgi:effector-binding domain-containing protein
MTIPIIAAAQENSRLGPISIETQGAMVAMTATGAGTMESLGQELGRLYSSIMAEIGKQQLQMSGPPFVHYLDYDDTSGSSNYMAGIPVVRAGEDTDVVHSVSYAGMKVVQALHTGPYEEFVNSYAEIGEYIRDNSLKVTGQAFEFYLTDPGSEPDPNNWKTLIAFPLKSEDGLSGDR